MNGHDIVLIQLKAKSLGIKRDTLASKIHCTVGKLNRVLDGKEENKEIERRLLVWLQRH